MEDREPKKKRPRGRPKGSKNKPKNIPEEEKEQIPEEPRYIEEDTSIEIFIDDLPDTDEFQQMLAEALMNASREKSSNNTCKLALASTIEEFVSSFILIGFDFKGDPVEIVKSSSSMENDALGMFLQKFVGKYLSNQFPTE